MSEDNKTNKGMSNIGAAAVGAAVGAAVAGAAVVLSDKNNRDKIADTAKNVVDESKKKFEEFKSKAGDAVEQGKGDLADKLSEVAKKLGE